ncbi:MAG: 4Fe-4S dicluster domain-containing protein, partial [Pseudomonadota bacterium]
DLSSLRQVVMIQCVGSRDDERSYCSRVCCSNAIKNAIQLKELNPRTSVYILFRDIRTYGLREAYYREAREKGVIFVRYEEEEKPDVQSNGNGLAVSVNDKMLGRTVVMKPDLLVLSSGIVANPGNKSLSQFLKVPLDADGFFLEAHVKLRPVDFATDGVFVCGLAHYPKDISETISQARAAAGRAATVLSQDAVEAEGKVSHIREELCSGCGACVEVCAYSAIELDAEKGVAVINEALCKGCGACAATCRANAVDLCGFSNEQILCALSAL